MTQPKTPEQLLSEAEDSQDFQDLAAKFAGPAFAAEERAAQRPDDEAAQRLARQAKHLMQTSEMLALIHAANERNAGGLSARPLRHQSMQAQSQSLPPDLIEKLKIAWNPQLPAEQREQARKAFREQTRSAQDMGHGYSDDFMRSLSATEIHARPSSAIERERARADAFAEREGKLAMGVPFLHAMGVSNSGFRAIGEEEQRLINERAERGLDGLDRSKNEPKAPGQSPATKPIPQKKKDQPLGRGL